MYQSRVSTFSQQSKIYGLKSLALSGISSINPTSLPGFANILCPTHSQYAITNICKSESCIEPLCPQCIPNHIRLHEQTKKTAKIETIVSARVSCIEKLAEQKFYIESDIQKIEAEYKSRAEEIETDLKSKLSNSKSKLLRLIQKIYQNLLDKIDIIYSAYAYEAEKNQNQLRIKVNPLKSHLETVTAYKCDLECDDFISTLIEVLSDFPKKPELGILKKNENFGTIEINDKSLEDVQKAIQKYVRVIVNVNVKQQRTNNLINNINSNNNKFSRINLQKSKSNDSRLSESTSRKSIFRDSSRNQKQFGVNEYFNSYKVQFQSNRENSINVLQSNYFKTNGILAYAEEKAKHYYLARINQAEYGFQKIHLNTKISIPENHRIVITPTSEIYLLGGKIDYQPTNRIFQIKGDILQECTKMGIERYSFAACYHNDSIYVAGGLTATTATNKFQKYELRKKVWISLKNCTNAHYNSEITSFNDMIIKVGGRTDRQDSINQIQLYNPTSDQWTVIPIQISIFKTPLLCGFVQISQTEILLFGGMINQMKQSECYRLEFKNDLFRIKKSIELYSASTFSNPTFIHNKDIMALQNTSKGTTKNIIKLNCNTWKFVSC